MGLLVRKANQHVVQWKDAGFLQLMVSTTRNRAFPLSTRSQANEEMDAKNVGTRRDFVRDMFGLLAICAEARPTALRANTKGRLSGEWWGDS